MRLAAVFVRSAALRLLLLMACMPLQALAVTVCMRQPACLPQPQPSGPHQPFTPTLTSLSSAAGARARQDHWQGRGL